MENISFDTKLVLFKEELINTINNSKLPLSVIEYILKDILQEVVMEKNKIINKEKMDILENKKKEIIDENMSSS